MSFQTGNIPLESGPWNDTKTSLLHVTLVAPFLMWMAYKPNQGFLLMASFGVAASHLYRLGVFRTRRNSFLFS